MSAKIVRLNGGFGNVLFQYAFGCRLDEQHGTVVRFDRTSVSDKLWARLQWFIDSAQEIPECGQFERFLRTGMPPIGRGRHRVMSALGRWTPGFTYQPTLKALPTDAETARTTYFSGYFQDQDMVDYILRRRSSSFLAAVGSWREKLLAKFGTAPIVSVHVRRGDYLNEHTLGVHGVMSGDYYAVAVDRIARLPVFQGRKPRLLVFTNGLKEAKAMLSGLSGDAEFSFFSDYFDGDDLDDFCAMTACDAHIVANSTFSYWAAALATNEGASRIAPVQWFADPVQNTIADRLFRSGWDRI